MNKIPFRRALISVYDKTGVEELAQALHSAGTEIVSTGSTAAKIAAAGVPVTEVSQLTGFPECLDGRVKTLHPRVHVGILADRRLQSHVDQLEELGIEPFDLVVCNLYPFSETVATGASFDECVEQIDIGGPSMVRAAAKNHASVTIVTDPDDYEEVIEAARAGGFTASERREYAAAAFAYTAVYDAAVADWFADVVDSGFAGEDAAAGVGAGSDVGEDGGAGSALPNWFMIDADKIADLRYGENPHQKAAVYATLDGGIAGAMQLGGKEMSYNNYGDADAALRAAFDHEEPCVAIIKHANPCGIALGADIAQAHRAAHACDPVSAYGGVIAANRPVTLQMAQQVKPIFTEVILAPGYDEDALELLRTKKNLRILVVEAPERGDFELKPISGGILLQERDDIDAPGDDPKNWQLVSGDAADEATLRDLQFAWRCVRAVRSNAILLAHEGATVGVGMGQVNRVDSAKLAIERANTLGGRVTGDAAADIDSAGGARAQTIAQLPERARGAVAASDAFFPFADGLQLLIDAGVRAVVQPGGSIRDEEVIEAAKAAGITMYLTGVRHFAH
ncbi:MAG: bifunctional phosphoribosylaminoimidazolecarboxamide formyltransferase/IMP cyclohydrolase [Actinomycetaceae bacterium]|nr:bifunctional phosphoribosylaminoimidazolecarboxamide formyltransferase/IMP cyclohydrolase [Actinomycetaceae bacterium]